MTSRSDDEGYSFRSVFVPPAMRHAVFFFILAMRPINHSRARFSYMLYFL